jgi:PmbA protein
VTDAAEETRLFAGSPAHEPANCFSADLHAVTPEQKIAFRKELEAECLRLDPRVTALAYNLLESRRTERLIASTRGLNRTERGNLILAFAGLMLKDGNETKMAARLTIARNFAVFNAKALAAELVAEAA